MMNNTRQPLLAGLAILFLSGCMAPSQNQPREGRLLGNPCLDGGNTEVCVSLGKRALQTTRPDYPEARLYLSRACLVNHPEGCLLFGELLQEGRGGPIDARRATTALSTACDGQVEDACIRLANLLLEENNPVADPQKALMLLWRTCESNPPSFDSCHRYGEALSEGVGQTSPNPEAALTAFQTACEGGLQKSCVRQALALTAQEPSDRFTQSPTLEQAGSLLRGACEAGDIDGCFALGELEREGRLEGASSVRAAMLFRRVCSEDPARGCFEVAQLMEQGLVKARKNEVASLYTVACENGRTEACTRRDRLPHSDPP